MYFDNDEYICRGGYGGYSPNYNFGMLLYDNLMTLVAAKLRAEQSQYTPRGFNRRKHFGDYNKRIARKRRNG